MKILWITNILFEYHHDMMGIKSKSVSGGAWLYAAYASSKDNKNIQLHIATTANIEERKVAEHDGHYFYILPGGGIPNYDINSRVNIAEWDRIRREVQPDAIIVWGSETRHAYLAMKTMKAIPKAIYMQGVISSIVSHYYEGVPYRYLMNTPRDFADNLNKNSQRRIYERQVPLEREMFQMAQAVIVENDWCEDMCKTVNSSLRVFRNNLPVREVFYQDQWSLEKMERFSIFSNAGGYPIKGHHILLKALSMVKQECPSFKCYIPGSDLRNHDNIRRRTGYVKYLLKLIKEGNLVENVIFTGALSSEQMVERLLTCNVYVMPSIVENHSSSLIEAMIVGAPCVSSLVGGVASLIEPKINGVMYNSTDADSLAGNILRIFNNDILAVKLGQNAVKIRQKRFSDFGAEMISIYNILTKIDIK